MPDTTVALGKGSRAGKYAVSPDQILAAGARAALQSGLGVEGAKVVQAILKTEGGLTGDVGDAEGGGSYGPTQLYWGGQLNNLAKDLGVSLAEAARWVQQNPAEAVQWSVNGYLGNAIKRGLQAGLRGADLATFAQKYGQVSVSPERAGQVFSNLFGGGGGLLGATTAEAAGADDMTDDGSPRVRVYRGGQEVDPATPGLETQQASQQQQATATPQAPKGAEVLQDIVRRKGQPVTVLNTNATIKNPTPATALEDARGTYKETVTNPSPTYRYVFRDGTHLDIKANQDPNGSGPEASSYEVIGGTALASDAKAEAKDNAAPQVVTRDGKSFVWDPDTKTFGPAPGLPEDASQRPQTKSQYTTGPDGTIYKVDPQTGDLSVAVPSTKAPSTLNTSASEPWIVQQLPDGTTRQIRNPNYQPPRATGHVDGNRVVTIGPDGQLAGNTVIDPEAQALALQEGQQQVQQGALNIQKTQRDLLPPQLLAIQNHYALVKSLQDQVASGALSPDEANAYVQQSKAYTDAALQGATPFQIQKQAEDTARMARQQGIDIINQRLSTGSSLANSLLSGATGLVNGGALPVPGHGPYGIDPLGYAKSFLDDPDVGGGPQVSDFAKRLLMASRPTPAGL